MSAASSLSQAISELAGSFSGRLIQPTDPAYEEARKLHNGLIDKRPALIARCAGLADILDAVRLARKLGLEIAVRGGGHNVAGLASVNGGLMIDLSGMKGIHVDAKARKAQAQGGLVLSSGNARFMTLTAGLTASRKTGRNKLAAELGLAYTKTDIVVAADVDGEPGIGPDEIVAVEQTTANTLFAKLRYDRFLSPEWSLFAAESARKDRFQGLDLRLNFDPGVAYYVLDVDRHRLWGELGYDLQYDIRDQAGVTRGAKLNLIRHKRFGSERPSL